MAQDLLIAGPSSAARPVFPVTKEGLDSLLARLPPRIAAWLRANRFAADAGELLLLPDEAGGLHGAAFGLGRGGDPFLYGALATKLPPGPWALEALETGLKPELAALGFLLGAYSFARYRSSRREWPQLVAPAGVDLDQVRRLYRAQALVRDLINTPANDMGPAELEAAAREVAQAGDAAITVITGDALLKQNFPLVHAVGQASPRAPRLIDMSWGSPKAPKVTLIGKGVCFDTGGLDLKPSSAMALMKKDMGGAATVLGLAQLIMADKLDIRLRVIIPAVENSVSGNAFRPGDVYPSRKGLSVEIGNTDAEGRLILADALALADEEAPLLLVDLATLTGAARTALGPEIVPFYTQRDKLAGALEGAAQAGFDPLWRMPLWQSYAEGLDSRIADVNHVTEGGFAGSITAALFLAKFVERAKAYAHFDIYAWNSRARPGRPQGGEAQALRALYGLIKGSISAIL
jgi:leucyl aminopeptidase